MSFMAIVTISISIMNASAGKLKLKSRQSRSPPDGHVPDLPVPNLPRLASLPRLSSHGASGLPV
ncbi:hypothetical protein BHYA_0002g01710 [Botrytis hyacinthi]|uniref:Uncharacterized protein n=1 Tax=Botrytis hyacinthi TaxID=278943 RepID=A0A4Z1H2D5_9HELO|nr:hypothetical protein BHYA_0002g01710 [Botrytis hyacinthi]